MFVDGEAGGWDQVRAVAVQASCSPPGALGRTSLPGSAGAVRAARRYLAIEGHRALAAQEAVLPAGVRRLIDRATAARSGSPAASLALAAEP